MSMRERTSITLLACLVVFGVAAFSGCDSLASRFISKSVSQISRPVRPVDHKVEHPLRQDVGLSFLWIGHATVLIQIRDKVIITDPVFTQTVGLLAKRQTEVGIDPAAIGRLNVILISHLHFDHLSYSSLDLLPKSATLCVPAGGVEYIPEFGFKDLHAATPWKTIDLEGVKVTPVPVRHFGGRYGFDASWDAGPSWTGYVIQYDSSTIFFAGDTGYDPELFKEIGRRFRIDVALIPIAPIEPRAFMSRVHTDPREALQIFEDVGASLMIPIHHETFFQGLEPELNYAQKLMNQLIAERDLGKRVRLLDVGEQIIVKE